MKNIRSMRALAAVAAVALAGLGASGAAQARSDVNWSIGVGVPGVVVGVGNGYPGYAGYAPQAYYAPPPPVYYAPPRPVYYAPPRPVYYAPPVVVGAPVYGGYYRGGGHRHWRNDDGGWRGERSERGRHGHEH